VSVDAPSGGLRARRGVHNPRQVRLAIEFTNLVNLAARSDFIEVIAQDVQPGWPPEKYIVTYRCRGITGTMPDGAPVYGDFHQVRMYLPSDYPLREPHLKWLTPIWHPNIDHELPNHVCTNTAQNYFAGKPLSDLVRAVGEMVQYVRYHAAWVPPYPLDRAAAKWVVEYAEPRGLVSKTKPVDDRPLLRPQRLRLHGGPAVAGQEASPQPEDAGAAGPARRRIKLGTAPLQPNFAGAKQAGVSGVETSPHPLPPVEGTAAAPVAAVVYPQPAAGFAVAEGEDRPRSGSVAQRLTGALEYLGLRLGKLPRTCASCSNPLPPNPRFCPHCGEAAGQNSAPCGNCGSTRPLNARFCPRCGAAAAATPVVS